MKRIEIAARKQRTHNRLTSSVKRLLRRGSAASFDIHGVADNLGGRRSEYANHISAAGRFKQNMKKTPKPKDVDTFIAAAPKEVQGKLKELRATIRKAAPTAVEKIGYGMPYYSYKGQLAYFNVWTSHIGLYLPTPTIAEHETQLAGYETTKATVRFPLDERLPVGLIRTLIKARMKANEEKGAGNRARRYGKLRMNITG
jgi:uncharacterized protein YdhG (YjbR/CyaY superfamily)